MMKTKIWVSTSFSGFHQWLEAPEPVAFLRNLHRHKFNVRVTLGVQELDRELEFFLVQADVNNVIQEKLLPYLKRQPALSCENMACFIGNSLKPKYPSLVSVSVDEDGENGALSEF